MSFTFLSALSDVPDGGAAGIDTRIGDEPVALVLLRAGDQVRVFHNICPHAGRRLDVMPGRFIVDAGALICAAHGACFTIPNGDCTAGPCRGQSLQEVPCEVRDGGVWVGERD